MVVRQCGKRRETDDAGAAAGEPGIGIFRQTRQQPAAGNTVISVRMVCGQPVRGRGEFTVIVFIDGTVFHVDQAL